MPRKWKQGILVIIVAPFFLLLLLALIRSPIKPIPVITDDEKLISVMINKKVMALASISNQGYQIRYETLPTDFSQCDVVMST